MGFGWLIVCVCFVGLLDVLAVFVEFVCWNFDLFVLSFGFWLLFVIVF